MRPDPIYPDAPRPTVFADGIEFQDYTCRRLARDGVILQNFASQKYQCRYGENIQGWEIKLDRPCTTTGRLSIEIAERTRADGAWMPSGIYRDSWLYIQGNYGKLWIFSTKWLRRYYEQVRPEIHESYGTVRKFYLPIKEADRCAVHVLDTSEEIDQ